MNPVKTTFSPQASTSRARLASISGYPGVNQPLPGWQGRKPALFTSVGLVLPAVCYNHVNLLGIGLHSYGWFLGE